MSSKCTREEKVLQIKSAVKISLCIAEKYAGYTFLSLRNLDSNSNTRHLFSKQSRFDSEAGLLTWQCAVDLVAELSGSNVD